MSTGFTILGSSVLALLLAGYLAQNYLPPPKPKIVGIDLGTTYSCIGVYHAVSGQVSVIKDDEGHSCIPSVVAFSDDDIVVGYKASAQSDHNPDNTIYDAKRFIGKQFKKGEFSKEAERYQFKLEADEYGMVHYVIGPARNRTRVSPQTIGSHILNYLKVSAEKNLSVPVVRAVMSVPAEFSQLQRKYTILAAKKAGIDVLRVINEPTAAAMAYGLHKKESTRDIVVVDLGGGTLDVSLLNIQGGMFLTQAMAGNNHLGGQDFNQRLLQHLMSVIHSQYGSRLTDAEDIQKLRLLVEDAKLNLTNHDRTEISLKLVSIRGPHEAVPTFKYTITRTEFEKINEDLLGKVLEPIRTVLHEAELHRSEIDEIVLVGGSTRIPKVRQLIRDYFNKEPNVAIDPELAVTYGVAIQAGILGGMWPLTVSAIELPTQARKIHVH